MTDVDYVRRDGLQAIADELAALSWPAERSVLPVIADRLGWVLRLEQPGSAAYLSHVGASRATVNVLIDDGKLAQVKIGLSARVDEADPDQQAALAEVFTATVKDFQALFGPPAQRRRGEYPRTSWDLANGGRVAVQRLGAVVQLVVLQKKNADVERFEESRGIPDDRDPEAELV